MFGQNFTLFTLLGFRVRANVSWLFLAVLVTWSLASGFFPAQHPGLGQATYWLLGGVGMVGLFFSLLFHEFCHSLVARTYGLKIGGITLFLFGGVAEMEMEPPNPRTEFWIAIAGPISSVVLAVLFFGLARLAAGLGIPAHLAALPNYLALINLVLAIFNMLPGFPLDGGRVLRAALWQARGDLHWATRWASRMGQIFGLTLAGIGILNAVTGQFIGGMWWFLIGLFLHGAARASYQRLLTQDALKGHRVDDIMTRDPVTVPHDISLQLFVEDYLYRYSHDMFPVVRDGRFEGCITLNDVRAVPREQWTTLPVAAVASRPDESNSIAAGSDATDALTAMQKSANGRLVVTEGGRPAGMLVLKDLLHRLVLRSTLEDLD
jgi:Zn-dependent protease